MWSQIAVFGLLPFAIPTVYGWGATGHQAVGYVAMQFLSPKALSFVQSSLGTTYNRSLGPAATWADDVKSQTAYKWSSVLHYVDAEDDPPYSCSVSESRDCGDGKCILTAIANYTSRVVDTSLSATQRQEALKFLDHFIGDIGQPLHVEALEVGGNDIDVKCSGSTSNLHSVWDSGLVNKLVSSNYGNSVTTWANALVSRLNSGTYRSSAASWISCASTTSTVKRSLEEDITGYLDRRAITPLRCPLTWAADTNTFDCSHVFEYSSGQDLCTSSYYTNAVPVIETQIAKQGYRLAAWLNVLFDGSTNLP
ncbi:phospholipase C/P1 nuclease [Pluteus cervinus]|uniref:Phospholipase C/P1 nuclease n=1 Tax=Pluteus cervinus TaxID=181527 RepID=A0ACD3BG84_9AGAR|nr:phospholipase C/P1 nuclease [Pluteus cervinus]